VHITRELLVKFAREYVAKKTRPSNDIVAVYLTGSVLTEDPLIGGSTDIDLVVVHKENPLFEREVQRISYEFRLTCSTITSPSTPFTAVCA
jgi:Nucleotidyltransferase domain.